MTLDTGELDLGFVRDTLTSMSLEKSKMSSIQILSTGKKSGIEKRISLAISILPFTVEGPSWCSLDRT